MYVLGQRPDHIELLSIGTTTPVESFARHAKRGGAKGLRPRDRERPDAGARAGLLGTYHADDARSGGADRRASGAGSVLAR